MQSKNPPLAPDPRPLLAAIYFLESTMYLEEKAKEEGEDIATNRIGSVAVVKDQIQRTTPPTALLKNLGLAHVHLMKNKLIEGLPIERTPLTSSQVMKFNVATKVRELSYVILNAAF